MCVFFVVVARMILFSVFLLNLQRFVHFVLFSVVVVVFFADFENIPDIFIDVMCI